MRLRIDQIDLIGAERRVEFQPGLNIIKGPITSGKTTLLRLCRGLLGSGLGGFPVEVRQNVSSIAGKVTLGEQAFSIIRPFVTTPTAKVDIASVDQSLRLPATRQDASAPFTYTQWLLAELGLPRLEVPTAPSKPESEPSPVTISDYLSYCSLPQDEIDDSVFGSNDPFRNIKRKYVFQILYGIFDVQTAELQEELRQVLSELRALNAETIAFQRFLQGTALENRAEIQSDLDKAISTIADLSSEATSLQHEADQPEAAVLRAHIATAETALVEIRERAQRERRDLDELRALQAQLRAQSSRLTRSIVADENLSDFDFVICPRCGSSVKAERAEEPADCYLCLQPKQKTLSRQDFVHEQGRIEAQAEETRELLASRRATVEALEAQIGTLELERSQLGTRLDAVLGAFIADAASRIADHAARKASLEATVAKLREYISLFHRLDKASLEISRLQARRLDLEAAIEGASLDRAIVEERIGILEEEFERMLELFHAPRFVSPPYVQIGRKDYLPLVDGRSFQELSSQGLLVLVNVAHALAHQIAALRLGLPLPGILLIDGLTSNVGHEGEDLQRVQGVYDALAQISEEYGPDLQMIVADNDVPEVASRFVRVELGEQDRLIRYSRRPVEA